MAMRILNRSFSGGEITPELFGRLELSKVQEALALCRNFITLPHGPVVNRAGTEFVEEVRDSTQATRLIPFSYNNEQTFAIQVGAGYFRFHTQGGTLQCGALPAYVPSQTVTVTIASPAVVTWTAHGLANNDPVSFVTTGALPTGVSAGVTYYAQNVTANTFELATAIDGASLGSSGTQSGTHTGSYAYEVGSAVASGGVNYYCVQSHANQPPASGAYWYVMPGNGDYEIPNPNPYAAADLMDIHYTQSADVLTLTHPGYPITELRRYGATNWQLATVQFAPMIAAPVGTTSSGSPSSHQYVVTAVLTTHGRVHSGGGTRVVTRTWESLPSAPSSAVACDLSLTGAYISLSWQPVINATGYNVYKLIGGVYCYLGPGDGTAFTDTSASSARANSGRMPPLFSQFPSLAAPGQPAAAAVNYTLNTLNAVASGNGTPAISYGYVVTAVDASGSESYASSVATCQNNLAVAGTKNTISWPSVDTALRYNVYKENYGIYGFIGQVARGTTSFVDDNITADISRTPPLSDLNQLGGPNDYPASVAYYQQRRIFAGTLNQPQNVWATRSGTEADLTYTIPSRDDNRLAFRIAGREASAIRHIVPMQDLLFLSASCEWRCTSSTGVLTPSTLNVQPQSYIGASSVQPVVVGNAVLYGAARGGHIRQMGYNWQINGYQSTDASIFAPHLFDYNTIVDMAYSRGPIPILWCVSSNGKLLGMTWLPEQQISAWHQHDTGNGDAFESVCTISENNEDMLYAIVRRTVNGLTRRYVERLHTRYYSTLADAHYVDCGTTYNGAGSLGGTFARSGTLMTCTVAAHGLSNGQTYWFAFSDASFGALPAGQGYAVAVVDANTFTLTVPDAGATEGTITSTHTGAYSRDWTSIACTIAGHGLSAGQSGWLGFSDAALGAAPGGSSYVIQSVSDGNRFTISIPTAVAISLANPTVVTLANHGLAAGDEVMFFTTGALPVGLAAASPYYVVNASDSSFQLALTPGGAPLSTAPASAAVAIGTGAPATVTWTGHGLMAGTAVSFSTTGMLPAGIDAGAPYYVVNPTADTFQIAATPNGTAIATTSAGTGTQTCSAAQAGTHTCCHVSSAAVAISNGSPAVVTWNSHGLAAGAPVMFSTTGALPPGMTAGTTYYVLPLDANTFHIAATPNGAAIATTGTGSGTQTCVGSAGAASGTVTLLPSIFRGLTWLEGMTVNILADGAVLPPQTVTGGTVTFPVGVSTAHIGLPITAQMQTPPAAQGVDAAMAQGLAKNVNKVFLRTYRSSGILAGPDFDRLVPYRQRTVENPGSAPAMVSDEVEIVLDAAWGASGQVCIQQSDPLPLDIAAMTLEIATGGGV